jgi:PAS domain S-box-containing protein
LLRDEDKRTKAREELRESEGQLRLIVEKTPIPMVITDKEGNTEHFNGKFIKLFGWTTDDVRTPDEWWKAAYPDEKYRELVCSSWEAAIEKANINKTEIEPQQWQLTCKNGELRDVEFRMVPLSADRSVIAMNDITERKKAEDQLRQRLAELERYSRATVQREFRVRDLQEENEKLKARIEELEKR